MVEVFVKYPTPHQSVDLNEYISVQDGIIVIVVLIFIIFDLLLSEDSCKEREFGTEVA